MTLEELNLSDELRGQVEKLVQSETDKVRTDYSQRLRTGTEELNRYKPKEKSETEKALEERLSVLEAREQELATTERNLKIVSKLKEKSLPTELAEFLNVGEDVDATLDKVGAMLGNYFLSGSNRPTSHTSNRGLTKKDFQKLSYTERAKLFQENPTLYDSLK